MKKKYTLLIYEKEDFLNSILLEQLSYLEKYTIFIVNNEKKLLKMIDSKFFDLFVFNLQILNNNSPNFLKIFQESNKHRNIIGYYDKENKFD